MSLQKTLPEIQLTIDAEELPSLWAEAVETIEVTQAANTSSLCRLNFLLDRDALSDVFMGSSLSVTVNHSPHPLFKGELIACNTSYLPNGQKRIQLEAEDALHRLAKNRVVRQFQRSALNECIASILDEYEITLENHGGEVWLDNVMQWGQSDLEKLITTINRYGFHSYLHEDNLHVFDLRSGVEEHPLSLGETLLSVEIRQDTSSVYESVSVSRWDPANATCQTHTKAASELPGSEETDLPLNDETSSDAILNLNCVSSHDPETTEKIALASLAHTLAQEFTLSGIAEGDCSLRPGKKVTLENVEPSHQRGYVLTQCIHTLNRESGYLTEINSKPPALFDSPALSSTLAEVLDIDDPNQRGRIQVSYPALDNFTSDWLAVLFPAAGKNKGLFMLPDVGDEVLVHFIDGDVSQGVVIGGLYGNQQPPTSKNKTGRCQEYRFVTGGGQQLQLDDGRGAARLTNRDGSYLDLAPGKVTLHAATDLVIQAPGRSLVVKAQSIDFEQG